MELLETLGFKRGISVGLDKATEHDLISPYEMSVITFPVDSKNKTIKAGSKDKTWLTTERASLDYMETRINNAKRSRNGKAIEFAYLSRTRMIRTLPSRIAIAKKILARLISKYPDSKILVFAPDIAQCEELVPDCFYHSKSDSSGFDLFKAGFRQVLGSVNSISEGITVHADIALIVSGLSKARHTVQRLGRLLRKTADGKLGKAFLLVAEDTQDEKWAEDSLSGLSNVKLYKSTTLGL
jgi:superfamily II DNA or RNA helicase